MGAVIVLVIIVTASLICVRSGAVALELTGMDRDRARFQALSAFTNTGFTTREAEEITGFPVRRKIISLLIVLGHAGSVSVIATLAMSLWERDPLRAAENVGIIMVSVYILYRLARWRGLTSRMRGYFKRWLLKRYDLRVPTIEEMIRVAEGVGVARLVVQEHSPLVGRPLYDLGLKAHKVQILSIQRGEEVIAVPQGSDCLQVGDAVICYGDINSATELFAAIAPDEGPQQTQSP